MSNHSSAGSLNRSSELPVCIVAGTGITVCRAALVSPLHIFVLYLGLQQWRQHRSFNAASHSDIFTYHLAAFELIWLLDAPFSVVIVLVPNALSMKVMSYFVYMFWHGENFLFVLTCVEHYLAVVHPIAYMRLRNERGVRIRNISILCVWILSTICSCFNILFDNSLLPLPFLIPFSVCLAAVSFCSLSVLFVLVRPGPGGAVQDRKQADPVKQRAFYTVTAISVVLWLWFGGLFSVLALAMTSPASDVICAVEMLAYMMSVLSSSVLPLLYLHRAGKLSSCCCKHG